ncbi:hypothetical protein ASPZODRAFT_17577 [Penicilliopsis zonata CBS 506.65]|uniref:Bud22 domain-containing protein n=1 Tax=Penicilliopsis zonata CBS 506.65 TaxID=1073090 RepID=A0A1L9SDV6_9EURO|nr:hypothetical protein ASPZODRAFT_17577 [Penicilliopsis zonata CBS 506.65]OJJ45361.1 hypothetical protein ASPZODRAFT_17577 [Penicilliopsis zonata CBS 506.65]
MPKRKLSDLQEESVPQADPRAKLQLTRFVQKFDYTAVALTRALKTARGFERQKLGRREKTAKSEGNTEMLGRLDEEVKVLKTLELQTVAEKHIFKQLAKTKRIAETPVFLTFKHRRNYTIEAPKSTAEANVLARLFKSNPVQNVLPEAMNEFKKILGLDEVAVKQDKSGGKKSQDVKAVKATNHPPPAVAESEEDEDEDEEEDEDDQSPDKMDEDDDSESLDFAQFDSRLASASEDEEETDGSQSDSDGIKAVSLKAKDQDPRAYYDPNDISDSVSRSSSPDFSDALSSDDDEPVPPPKKTKSNDPSKAKAKSSSSSAAAAAAPAKDTTFLPSLMMGGYFSGSESEADGDNDAAEAPRRKNRMGQQARRALWEKKFGTRANHLQAPIKKGNKQSKDSRDSGWDVRKGATDSADYGARGKWGAGGGRGQGQRHGYDNARPGRGGTGGPSNSGHGHSKPSHASKSVDANKPLHPSWEAARRAKEQASQASFQGKKVVFD